MTDAARFDRGKDRPGALTAYSHTYLVTRAKETGVVGYLVKKRFANRPGTAIEVALARFRVQDDGSRSAAPGYSETRKFVDRAKGI